GLCLERLRLARRRSRLGGRFGRRSARSIHPLGLLRLRSLVEFRRTATRCGRLPQLPDAGLLPSQLAQVVQLRPANAALGHDLDLGDRRRMQGEGPLDADPEGDLAHGERLAKSAAMTSDHDPLEDLDLLTPAFRHTYVPA